MHFNKKFTVSLKELAVYYGKGSETFTCMYIYNKNIPGYAHSDLDKITEQLHKHLRNLDPEIFGSMGCSRVIYGWLTDVAGRVFCTRKALYNYLYSKHGDVQMEFNIQCELFY